LTVGWTTWKAGTNGFDNLHSMGSLQFQGLVGDVIIQMMLVWLAFIDQTINKVQELSGIKTGDTQMFSRPIQVEGKEKVV
jgi:hypothetical protein